MLRNNNICTRFWKAKMKGRVRQKLNINKIFTNIWETVINLFGVYVNSTFGLFTAQKFDETRHTYRISFPSVRSLHAMFRNLGNNKQENTIRISLLSPLAAYKL